MTTILRNECGGDDDDGKQSLQTPSMTIFKSLFPHTEWLCMLEYHITLNNITTQEGDSACTEHDRWP